MKYDTYNLDEAAYLALQGYNFTVTRTSPVSALFSFEKDENFAETSAEFWKGEVNVPLHRWLATRAALKNECIGQARSAKHVTSPSLVPGDCETNAAVSPGSQYWFHDGSEIKRGTFGKKSVHASRFKEGNFYPTLDDAKARRNARQVARAE